MSRSKQDQRIAMEQNKKVSMEPILQDFSITSLSEMSSEVLPPNDSSLFEKVINYDVALPDLTLNETNDVNLSSDQYPPDTTMMDITKMNSPKPMFKKPFISRPKRKPRLSLFEKDIEDSENDTPKPKIRKPFQRKVKVAMNENEFENLFNSSNDSTCTSPYVNSNLITRRRKRVKKKIDNSLFDKDLNSSENDKSFSLRRTLLRRKVNSKKVTSTEFEEVLDNTLNASQTDESQHKIPFRNRLQSKQKQVENTLFESDLNSSNSFQDSSRFLICEDKKREFVQILNENKTNCSINSVEKVHKNSPLISTSKRLSETSNSHQQIDEPQLKKLPIKNMLQRQQKKVEIGLFDSDLNSSESFQENCRLTCEDKKGESEQVLDENIQNCTVNNLDKIDKDSYIISGSYMSTSKSQSNVESDSFGNDINSSYSLQLSPSLTINKENESDLNDTLNDSKQYNNSNTLSESSFSHSCTNNNHEIENKVYDLTLVFGEGTEESLKSKNISPIPFEGSETPDILKNCQRIEHSQENCDLLEVQSYDKPESIDVEAIESNINNTNKSITTETNCYCSVEKFEPNNLYKNVPNTQNEQSLLSISDPECNIAMEKNYSQNNKTTLLDEKEKSGRNNSLEHNDSRKTVTSEFNQLLPNNTSSKLNILDVSSNINESVIQSNKHPDNCTINTSLPKEIQEHTVGSNNRVDSSYINCTDKCTKNNDIECESPKLSNEDAYLITRKSINENLNNIKFSINSLNSENLNNIQTKCTTNIDCPTTNIDCHISDINIDYSRDIPINVNCESINISNPTLKKRKVSFECDILEIDSKCTELRRSVRKSAVNSSNCTEQQSTSKNEQSEFSLFVEQSSKSVTSNSAFIDIHASKCTSSSVNLTSSNQASKSINTRDTSSSGGDVSSSGSDSSSDAENGQLNSLENNDQTSAVEDEFTERMEEYTQEVNEVMLDEESQPSDKENKTDSDYEQNSTNSKQSMHQTPPQSMHQTPPQSMHQTPPQVHLGTSEKIGDNSLSVSNLTLHDRNLSFKVPNKPLKRISVSKKLRPEPLNKTKVQEMLDNMPYSELKRKKQKSVAKTKPTQLNLSDDNEKIKRKPCIIATRLKKPQKWISSKFYQFIIKKLSPRFGLMSRVKAEQVVFSLVDYVNRIMNENSHYYEIVEEMKRDLAEFGIIKTHLDFHEMVHNYFAGRFFNKLFPLHDVDNWNPFEPDDLSESIL